MITHPEKYQEINGNLISLALEGQFDVVVHGCNCFNNMGAGIAPQMARAFHCDNFPLEQEFNVVYNKHGEEIEIDTYYRGDANKLGQIDYMVKSIQDGKVVFPQKESLESRLLTVVNAYTQYGVGKIHKPLDYEALTLCLRKINLIFHGLHIGLPQIGCGLAGGEWNRVKQIIQNELKDCKTTIVIYDGK